ncbi:MAG TPA: NUDIX hydrolase [Patescibacteria group bacterium]|nr:NUDIX hydrolase [Patescibacteria group bacterium]
MITCQFEDGGKAKLRHVTTAAIVKNNKDEVLLVRRAPGQLNENKFTLPGGFLNRDEDSREGAIREMFEETGLEGKISYLFHIVDTPNRPKEDRQNVEFRYVVEVVGGEEKLSSETTEIKWVSEKTLPPDEEFAFDHRKTIIKYFDHLREPITLPVFN